MVLETIKIMGAKIFINKYFDGLGEVLDLDIDNAAKIIGMIVLLRGEEHAIKLHADYRLEPDGVTVLGFRCERAWIETALNRFLAGKKFDITDGLVKTTLFAIL